MTFDEMKSKIKASLPEKRFNHVMAVVEEARALAEIFEIENRDNFIISALLHDCTKPFSYDEHLEYAKSSGLVLSDDDLASPEVLHSRTGAVMAKKEFLQGDDAFDIIYCHSTGKADMSLEEKLIFLADYIENTRVHEVCRKTRLEFYTDLEACISLEDKIKVLDKTVLKVLQSTVSHLKDKNAFIHSDTLRAIEFLKSEENHERKKRI